MSIGSSLTKHCHLGSEQSKTKKLLFTVTKKDLRIDFFRAGGPGGQKQNKTSSACRILHLSSGAIGESREERSQIQNKKIAFRRMIETKKFQTWVKVQASARLAGFADVEAKVKAAMEPGNIKIEVGDGDVDGWHVVDITDGEKKMV
ncbi:MAG: peptide chain release factor-like protein [archaeon]